MPIHTSWKSMFLGMKKQYCGGGSSTGKTYEFSDGTKSVICKKGASVFFASLNKRGWDDTKPRPNEVNETVFQETVREVLDDMILWVVEGVKKDE